MDAWPISTDYTVAIQAPQVCFRDTDLKISRPELHTLTRMPKVWAGNFAQVYELINANRRWAVKCFTRSSSDIRRRYSIISDSISSSNLSYFIDFRFINDEILVGGKRYPIVKMEWVEGQTLDKYIEANLYKPHSLTSLASRLIEMVSALESKGLAHGDIQHGNVLISNGQLKLVDYDGMFVPQFRGSPAPEQGLPSYQHPRRNSQFYDSTLDRFPVLVICTALCALAFDPTLWYEFSTGDNLLFTKEDFEHPNKSSLFSRLKTSSDDQVRQFTELLRVAIENSPSDVSIHTEKILSPISAQKPWWTTATSQTSVHAAKVTAISKSQSLSPSISSRLEKHKSFFTAISFIVGYFILLSAGLLGLPVISWLSVFTGLVYLIERLRSFKQLPVFNRRNSLSKRLQELEYEIKQRVAEQNKLQAEPARLTQLELQEKSSALKDYQEKAITDTLSKIDITKLSSIRGVGPHIIGNLRAAGFHTAADLRSSRLYSVKGIGSKRSGQIRGLLSSWERTAKQNLPSHLPYDAEMRITSKYSQQRQSIINHLSSVGQKLNALRSEQSQRQSEFNQLYIPGFGEYLKHNF